MAYEGSHPFLRDDFLFIAQYGPQYKSEKWNSINPLMDRISHQLKNHLDLLLSKHPLNDTYKVHATTGSSGNWAVTPFCALLSSKYSKRSNYSPSYGMYPAYLFSPDCSKIYLTYMLASGTRYERILRQIKEDIQKQICFEDFDSDTTDLDFGTDSHNYKACVIYHKTYHSAHIPSEEILEKDLFEMLSFHEREGEQVFQIIRGYYKTKYLSQKAVSKE